MGPIQPQQIGAAQFTVTANTAQFNQALTQAQAHAATTSKTIGQSLGKGGNAAQGLLALSQLVDDAQYGFKSIVNNIPQVASMFGAAGLAGAIGIAAVAVNQLIQHWDTLSQYFERADVRIQAQWMADLAEATKKAADEADRLLAAKTPAQEKLQGAVNAAIMGADPKVVLMGIQDVLLQTSKSKVSQRGGKFFEQGKQLDITEERARAIWADERAKIDARAKNLLGSMSTDDHARRLVQDMIQKFPDAFPGLTGAGQALKAASPEEQAKKAMNDRARMLTGQGAENEKIWQGGIGKELTKAGEEIEKQTRDKFDKDKEADKEKIGNQIAHLEERRDRLRKEGQFSGGVLGSTHAFANHMLTQSIQNIPRQQLKQAELLNRKIDSLRADLKNLNGMRFKNN